MTQFILCKGLLHSAGGMQSRKLSDSNDRFLLEVAPRIFPGDDLGDLYVVGFLDNSIDFLCTSGQRYLAEGVEFEETEIYQFLMLLTKCFGEFVLWYGADFDDLDCVVGVKDLMAKVEAFLTDSSGEIYLHFNKYNADC